MKQTSIVFCVALSLFVAGCSKEDAVSNGAYYAAKVFGEENTNVKATSDRPMPEKPLPPEFPTNEEIQAKIAQNLQYLNNKISQKDGKTTLYFKGKKGNYEQTDNPKEAEYYRLILGKTADNACVAQDFYINGTKRSEAYAGLDYQKCVSKWNTIQQKRDYSIFVFYDVQKSITLIDDIDRQNKIRYLFSYDEKTKTPYVAILDNITLKTRTVFYFDDNSIVHFDFNQSTITTFFPKPETVLKFIVMEEKIDLTQQQIQETTWLAPDGKKAFESPAPNNDRIKLYQYELNRFSEIEEMMNRE